MRSLFANIFTTLHPRLALQALSLFLPWRWKVWRSNNIVDEFVREFRKQVGIDETYAVVPMYNARSALYHGMHILGIGPGDEVILQGYTCVSVPNAIIATGATPVYVDIDPATANIDPTLVAAAITEKTKAILVQHTFGIVADMQYIKDICQTHDLLLIEDCAHALGATYEGISVGTFGDMALYSLGRDKVLTTTNGGILVMPKTYITACERVRNSLVQPSYFVMIQNLVYLIIGWISYKLYDIKIGKIIYFIAAKAKLLPLIITAAEKTCSFTNFSFAYPPVLGVLGITELQRLKDVTMHRRNGASYYKKALGDQVIVPEQEGDISLRVIFKTTMQASLIKEAKRNGLHLGDPWYDKVIAGRGVDLEDAAYIVGSCPHAEALAQSTINLPNHTLMHEHDYKRVINFFRERKS